MTPLLPFSKSPIRSKSLKRYFVALSILALLVFIAKLFAVFHPSKIVPRHDGLYYLFFSEHLRLVYPDHNPLIAYILWAARSLFSLLSPGSFNDYLPQSLVLIPLTSISLYLLLYIFVFVYFDRVWKDRLMALLVLFSLLLAPYYFGTSFLTTPETPLTFFAFLAVLAYQHAFLHTPKNTYVWLLAGALLALAFLSKITAIFLGLSIAAYAFLSKNRRAYLSNYRFYLSFLPSLFAGLIVLYADYKTDFRMIRYLFERNNRGTNLTFGLNVLGNQFIYYTPLYYAMLLVFPIFYTINYYRKKIANTAHNELYFFLATIALLCSTYFLYKIFTIRVLNWWGGYMATPAILLACFFLRDRLQFRKWYSISLANFFIAGLICLVSTFHSVYGVFDPTYKTPRTSNGDKFPAYNTAINGIAHLVEDYSQSYPTENANWFYIYQALKTDFKKYYEQEMNPSIPIVNYGFGSTVFVHYYVRPEIPAMALTKRNSTLPIKTDGQSIFDYLFHQDDLKGKSFYLITRHHPYDLEKRIAEETSTLSKNPTYCSLQKTLTSKRIGKTITHYVLYLCKNKN